MGEYNRIPDTDVEYQVHRGRMDVRQYSESKLDTRWGSIWEDGSIGTYAANVIANHREKVLEFACALFRITK